MIVIRLPKKRWAKAWRAMVEVGPLTMIAADPVFEVLASHLDVLESKGFAYEVLGPHKGRKQKPRHASSD